MAICENEGYKEVRERKMTYTKKLGTEVVVSNPFEN